MQVKKQQKELDMEQQTGSKLGKAVYCHPAYLTIWRLHHANAGLDEAQAEINIARRNSNNLRYTNDTTTYGRNQRGTKEPLDESERESEKTGLKLYIQKMKIMASSPITSWQIDGETMETVTDFIFLGSKITQIVTTAMKLKDTCSLK